jgi:peptidyl-prolyl cis-trans isomerase C
MADRVAKGDRETLRITLFIGVLMGFLLGTGGVGLSWGSEPVKPEPKESVSPVLARVGNHAITLEELNLLLQANPQIAKAGDSLQRKKILLEHMVNQSLFVEDATRMGIDKRSEVVRALEALRFQVLLNAYMKDLGFDRITVGEDEVKAYWEQYSQEFATALEVRYRQILIRAGASDPEGIAARQRAEAILAKVRAGEDFGKLATEHTDDQIAKGVGGDQGFVQKGKLSPEVDAVVFSLKPGETSGIIRTGSDYVLIKVEDRREPKVKPLAMVKRQISELLLKKRQQDLYQRQVEAVKQRIPVEVHFELLEAGER